MSDGNGMAHKAVQKFGTFGGVFTPSTLTILGVIMFLRFEQVVGESWILPAVIIILCAKLITTLTAFSLSAIATKTRVEGDGAYFLISRSLGVEFGGAIGIVFFLAQAISVAMYVIRFTEALTNAFPEIGMSPVLLGSLVNLFVFVCVFIGAGWTIKLQSGILIILSLSIVSFFAGAIPFANAEQAGANLGPAYSSGQGFFTMFALFSPAVTGIMAGVNMSGNLESPRRSIPKSTLEHILKQNHVWSRREIRILQDVAQGSDSDKSRQPLPEMMERSRIEATPVILPNTDASAAMRDYSRYAAVVMIDFEPPLENEEEAFHDEIDLMIQGLQHVLLVPSAGGVSLAV